MKISKETLREIIKEEFLRAQVLLEAESAVVPPIDLHDANTITRAWLLAILDDDPTESESILLSALEDSGFPYEMINSDEFELLHSKLESLADELELEDAIIVTDGSRYSLPIKKDSRSNLRILDFLLPAAERICSLLPVICNASITFIDEDGENNYSEEELEYKSIGIVHPYLRISLGDSPSDDYNDDFLAVVEKLGTRGKSGHKFTLESIATITGTSMGDGDWFVQQSLCTTYDELDPKLKSYMSEVLEEHNEF